jgi:hypothetical protein
MGEPPASGTWTWEKCEADIRSLSGRLGFPKQAGDVLEFLRLRVIPAEKTIRDTLRDDKPVERQGLTIAILHYYSKATEIPLTGNLISFRQLPGGMAYDSVFRKRAVDRIARVFGERPEALEKAALVLRGRKVPFQTTSVQIPALPLVPLTVNLWSKSVEFQASASILFDSTASHYLPTEPLSYLGELVSIRLRQADTFIDEKASLVSK